MVGKMGTSTFSTRKLGSLGKGRRPHFSLALCGAVLLGWSAAELTPQAGESVRGLQVSVRTAETVWRLGESNTFDVTLTNVGETTYLVDLFGDLHEVYQGKRRRGYVPSCWAFTWQPQAVVETIQRGPYTLFADQFRRLAPGESVTKRLTLTLSGVAPGTYQVKLTYVPRGAGAVFSFPDHWETQQGFKDPMWIGMALSNPLTVEVAASP